MPKMGVPNNKDTHRAFPNLVFQLYLIVPHAVLLDPAIALQHLKDRIGFFFAIAFKIADLAL